MGNQEVALGSYSSSQKCAEQGGGQMPMPSKQSSPLKSALKKAKEAFVSNKGKFAEGDEELKKIGESLEKMNFDEGEEGEEEESDTPTEQKESVEHLEQIQEILPQLDEEKLELVLGFLNQVLEGKEPEMAMQEKKMPMDQSRANKNPNQNAPASFGESQKHRIPKWLEQTFSEMRAINKELSERLNQIDSEKKSKEDSAKFQQEVDVALKSHPQREKLKASFMNTFSESGVVVARETMKNTLAIASSLPLQNEKRLPRQLNENFSESHVIRDIPEIKKYEGNPEHLKSAIKYAEIYQSRKDNTMSFGEYIEKGLKADFAELRGDVRTSTKTFNETK